MKVFCYFVFYALGVLTCLVCVYISAITVTKEKLTYSNLCAAEFAICEYYQLNARLPASLSELKGFLRFNVEKDGRLYDGWESSISYKVDRQTVVLRSERALDRKTTLEIRRIFTIGE